MVNPLSIAPGIHVTKTSMVSRYNLDKKRYRHEKNVQSAKLLMPAVRVSVQLGLFCLISSLVKYFGTRLFYPCCKATHTFHSNDTHTHSTHSQFTLANKHSNHNEVKMYIHQSLKVDINSSQCLTIQRDNSSIIIVLKLTTCIPYSKSQYQEKCSRFHDMKKQLTLSKINIQFD